MPDPQGALAKDIPSSAIFSTNIEVQRILQLKVDPLAKTLGWPIRDNVAPGKFVAIQ